MASGTDKAGILAELRETSSRPVFAVWDGCFYFYRALSAFPEAHHKGQPINGVLGALSMICTELTQLRPKYTCIVFDHPTPNFRHLAYPDYKQGLWAAPYEELVQLYCLQNLLRLLGFPVQCIAGVEGDDTIATLIAQKAVLLPEVVNTVVLTGDKDLQGLTSYPRVKTFDSRGNMCRVGTRKEVAERFGILPERMADYLALVGDANDNIPGVAKCGPDAARKLLAEYESVQGISEAALNQLTDDTAPKDRRLARLLPNKTAVRNLMFCFALTSLKTNLKLPYSDYRIKLTQDYDLVKKLLTATFGDRRLPKYVDTMLHQRSLDRAGSLFGEVDEAAEEDKSAWVGMGSLFAGFTMPEVSQ